MSDFDEEAEREKLREKYEREERRRETTERMSELLLKGATMTNAHCSDCGDPIFRYDGQEFCPTCEKPVDRAEGNDGADGAGEADEEHTVEVTSPSDDARVRFGGEDGPEEESPSRTENSDRAGPETGEPETEGGTHRAPSIDPSPETRVPESTAQPGDATDVSGDAGDVSSNVTAARGSLARTVNRFASAAEATEDPAVAREHLEAAKEAAATLAALD